MHGNLCFHDFRPKRVAPPQFISLPLAGTRARQALHGIQRELGTRPTVPPFAAALAITLDETGSTDMKYFSSETFRRTGGSCTGVRLGAQRARSGRVRGHNVRRGARFNYPERAAPKLSVPCTSPASSSRSTCNRNVNRRTSFFFASSSALRSAFLVSGVFFSFSARLMRASGKVATMGHFILRFCRTAPAVPSTAIRCAPFLHLLAGDALAYATSMGIA
eukprot:gene3338-biopygen2176